MNKVYVVVCEFPGWKTTHHGAFESKQDAEKYINDFEALLETLSKGIPDSPNPPDASQYDDEEEWLQDEGKWDEEFEKWQEDYEEWEEQVDQYEDYLEGEYTFDIEEMDYTLSKI